MLHIDAEEVLAFAPDLDRTQVDILIRDGLAMARRVAPCIDDEDFAHVDAAVAIIRSAVLRWAESGSGSVSSQQFTAGPFGQTTSFDTRQARRSLFWPSEIKELEALCADKRGAFAVDTLPPVAAQCGHGCGYLVGSLNSACAECGRSLRRVEGWP